MGSEFFFECTQDYHDKNSEQSYIAEPTKFSLIKLGEKGITKNQKVSKSADEVRADLKRTVTRENQWCMTEKLIYLLNYNMQICHINR